MKGLITHYNEEKGYGFLKDQEESSRFFHISNVNDSNYFLSNLPDYVFNEHHAFPCYVVTFTPSENERGLVAKDINLTEQLFNDPEEQIAFPAVVTDLRYEVHTYKRISTGHTQDQSPPFFATAGANGTYRIGYPEVSKELNITYRRLDDIGWGTIEVRELALKINERSKITDTFVEKLKSKMVGTQFQVILKGDVAVLVDNSALDIS